MNERPQPSAPPSYEEVMANCDIFITNDDVHTFSLNNEGEIDVDIPGVRGDTAAEAGHLRRRNLPHEELSSRVMVHFKFPLDDTYPNKKPEKPSSCESHDDKKRIPCNDDHPSSDGHGFVNNAKEARRVKQRRVKKALGWTSWVVLFPFMLAINAVREQPVDEEDLNDDPLRPWNYDVHYLYPHERPEVQAH